MKRIHLLLFGLILSSATFAQRFVVVNTEEILKQLPEYEAAQNEINIWTEQWSADVEKRYKEIDQMYKSYQAEQVLLTEDMKNKKISEIEAKERSIVEFRKEKFGPEGELFKKREELIKPIQDKVYEAIKTMAETKAYNFVFDKSEGVNILFTDPKYDKSEDVVKAIKEANKAGN